MNKEVHIVTGATGAIGRSIVEALIKEKVSHVILACRNTTKASKVITELSSCGETVLEFMSLDLESLTSVKQFCENFSQYGYTVKALFNNAGTMPKELSITADGLESATQTNYVATWLLTEGLLQFMDKGSRIVFTTSLTRYIVRLHDDWKQRAITHHHRFTTYGRSKLMLTQAALQLSRRLRDKDIKVNCSDPGIVDSDMIKMGYKIIDTLCDRFFRPYISTPAQGAQAALNAYHTSLSGYIFTKRKYQPIKDKKWTLPDLKEFIG